MVGRQFLYYRRDSKTNRKGINNKKYKNFIGIANGEYAGFARIYVLASEIIAYTENRIEKRKFRRIFAKLSEQENTEYG